MKQLIARKRELKQLEQIWNSKFPEFIALYGRRRVGKTHLIREYFHNKGAYVEVTGSKDGDMHTQLSHFTDGLAEAFYPGIKLQAPKSWNEAFRMVTDEIDKLSKTKKICIFLDELPWLTTRRSQLIQQLDYYWNRYWSKNKNIRLIVCGSAAHWMLSKLINAKGGLHNRLTQTILLEPFNLKATADFLHHQGIKYNQKQVLQIYMVTGGVVHYLKQVKKGKSATQNINSLCFDKSGLLYNEFYNLFSSLFDNVEFKIKLLKAIANKSGGILRKDLLKTLKLETGGFITTQLNELKSAGFLQATIPYNKKSKEQRYRVIDEYTLFYLQWIEPSQQTHQLANIKDYWQRQLNTPKYNTWSGYAFENVCYKHINQIANQIELNGFSYEVGTWQHQAKSPTDQGAQIDLLFYRADGIITLCEIKYSDKQYVIGKEYARNLANKLTVFQRFHPNKQLLLTMITTHGTKKNLWSEELVDSEMKLEDLFDNES